MFRCYLLHKGFSIGISIILNFCPCFINQVTHNSWKKTDLNVILLRHLHIPQRNTYLSEVICWKLVKMMVEIMYHLSCMKPLWNHYEPLCFGGICLQYEPGYLDLRGHPGQFGSNSLRQPSASSWSTAPRTCKNDRFQSMACFPFLSCFFWLGLVYRKSLYTLKRISNRKRLELGEVGTCLLASIFTFSFWHCYSGRLQ